MENNEAKLYEEAEARVGFKKHVKTYAIVTLLIWIFWAITRAQYGHFDGFWPIYPTLGWGIGIISHYMGVYGSSNNAIEKEVARLKKERELN